MSAREPKDHSPDSLGIGVTGASVIHMQESARVEAARVFGVPTSRVVVQIESVSIATRDPFPTDLNTYAAINQLSGFAKCTLKKDPNMPEHDTL